MKEEIQEHTPTFTKEQILKSKRYQRHRDILSVLLKDDGVYSHADIERLTGEFSKRKVS